MKRLCLLAAFLLVGCSRADAPRDVPRMAAINAELTYYSSYSWDDPFAVVIAQAVGEYEAISGNRVSVVWSGQETSQEVLSRHQDGTRLDVWDGDMESQLALNAQYMLELGAYYNVPLPQFLGVSMRETIDHSALDFALQMSWLFAPNEQPEAEPTQELLMVPFAPYSVAFVYDSAYFLQAGVTALPKTWQEFVALCERLRTRGFVPLSVQMHPYLAYGYYLALSKGTDWVRELMATPTMWTDPAVYQMARAFEALERAGYLSRHEYRASPGPHAVLNNKVAMRLMNTADIHELVQEFPGRNFGAFNFPRPALSPPDQRVAAMHGSRAFFVSKQSQHPDYAFELIATILSPNFDQQLALATCSMPFAADIPWPEEIRGILQSFREIEDWVPYGGGTLDDVYARMFADAQFLRILKDKMPAREFIDIMMKQ